MSTKLAAKISHHSKFFAFPRLPRCNIGFVRVHVEARQLVLFIGAVALAACWVVYRKEKFSWILQDILGFAFRYVKRVATVHTFVCFNSLLF